MFAGIPQEETIEEEEIRDEVELITQEESEELMAEEIIDEEVEETPKETKNKQTSLFDF